MAPTDLYQRQAGPVISNPEKQDDWNWRAVAKPEDLVLESWSQGLVVGSLMLMACITLANMHRRVTLHKLIFAEQAMALTHGTFCFMTFTGYGWYLSSTAALLYLSYILHNVVAWLKVRPFFHGKSTIFTPKFVKWTTRIYLYSLALTVPAILFQITDNFRYFNGYGGWYAKVRPYEPLMRDPWWVFTCGILFYVISKSYGMGIFKVIQRSPRFGILFTSIILALIFTALDIAASIHSFIGSTDGINPFWKLSLIFKCLTDAILLDDFKTELKRLGLRRMKRDEKRRESHALVLDFDDRIDSDDEAAANYSNGLSNGHRFSTASYTARHSIQPSHSETEPRKSGGLEESEEVEFMAALQPHPSELSSDRESRRSSSQRPQVGQGGRPITKLPRFFAAIKPGKKQNTDPTQQNMEASKSDDAIDCNESHLEHARLEQQRTIEELKRRRDSNANGKTNPEPSVGASPLSPPSSQHTERRSRPNASQDFWGGMDDIDEDRV